MLTDLGTVYNVDFKVEFLRAQVRQLSEAVSFNAGVIRDAQTAVDQGHLGFQAALDDIARRHREAKHALGEDDRLRKAAWLARPWYEREFNPTLPWLSARLQSLTFFTDRRL